MALRPERSRADARPAKAEALAPRAGLAWPRLPAAAELATIGTGYAAYALVRLAIRSGRDAASGHAAQLWQAERRVHLTVEPFLNHLTAAAHPVLAEAAGYYCGLFHFIITALVLAWLYRRRPAAFGPLRSALVLATAAANVVFGGLAGCAAPVLGARDDRHLGYPRHPRRGPPARRRQPGQLYAAMPSLHVAWAAWCAVAIVIAARTRWRHLAWFYPAATTVVVLAPASHFLLDAAGGLAVAGLGLLASRPGPLLARRLARRLGPASWCALASGLRPAAASRGRPASDRAGTGQTGCGPRAAIVIGLCAVAGCPLSSPALSRHLMPMTAQAGSS